MGGLAYTYIYKDNVPNVFVMTRDQKGHVPCGPCGPPRNMDVLQSLSPPVTSGAMPLTVTGSGSGIALVMANLEQRGKRFTKNGAPSEN